MYLVKSYLLNECKSLLDPDPCRVYGGPFTNINFKPNKDK